MTFIQTIEQKLNDMLVKDAPVQLPENWRKWIATYAWLFALIGFILGVLALLLLLPALGLASVLAVTVNTGRLLLFTWLAFFVELGYVILLGIAIPKLKRLEKTGWNLIFYSALFFFVYNIFYWFQLPSFGAVFSLIWSIFWSVVWFYFIFQIRGQFKEVTVSPAAQKEPARKKSTKSKQ